MGNVESFVPPVADLELNVVLQAYLIVHSKLSSVIEHVEGAGWSRVVAPAAALGSEATQHRVGLCVIVGHGVESAGFLVSSALAHCLPLTTPAVIAGEPRVRETHRAYYTKA